MFHKQSGIQLHAVSESPHKSVERTYK